MRLEYICSHCGADIDDIEVDVLDETAFGFDCLSESERQELLFFDPAQNTLTVKSLCDHCIDAMHLKSEPKLNSIKWLH